MESELTDKKMYASVLIAYENINGMKTEKGMGRIRSFGKIAHGSDYKGPARFRASS